MKKILFVFVILLAMSCSKKGDPINKIPSNCELSGYTTATDVVTISYNAALLVDSVHYVFNDAGVTGYAVMKYDVAGHLTDIYNINRHSVFQTGTNGKPAVETDFFLKKSGGDSTVYGIPQTFTYVDSLVRSVSQYGFTRYEYDTKGNLSKVYLTEDVMPEFLFEEYADYDDKISPFINFPFTIYLFLESSGLASSGSYAIVAYEPIKRNHNFSTLTTYYTSTDSIVSKFPNVYNQVGYVLTSGTTSFGYNCK